MEHFIQPSLNINFLPCTLLSHLGIPGEKMDVFSAPPGFDLISLLQFWVTGYPLWMPFLPYQMPDFPKVCP